MAAHSADPAVHLVEGLLMIGDLTEEDASTRAGRADAHVRAVSAARIDGSSPKPT